MIRPLAAFLHALDAARTAGTLARTVRVLARQLDNAHLLAASEGARADRAEAALADAEAYAAAIERSFSAEPTARVIGCAESLHQCAASHDPGVRLLGNLTAQEIAEVARLTLGQARRVAELEAQLEDWREASGELAAEQPADDALPDLTDAGEAPIPMALTDSACEADIQRDRADALFASLQACEVDLAKMREAKLAADIRADVQRERAEQAERERDTNARAAGAHIATIERLRGEAETCKWQHLTCSDCGAMQSFIGQGLYECWKCTATALREQIAAAHRAAHARARSLEERADIARRAWDESPPADPGPVEWDELPPAGQAAWCAVVRACDTSAAPTEQIPGVAAVGPYAEWSAEYDAIESARERAGTDDSPPTRPSERAATRTT